MEMVYIMIKTLIHIIKEIGKMVKGMDMVYTKFHKNNIMKEVLKNLLSLVKEFNYFLMEICTLEIIKMANLMD